MSDTLIKTLGEVLRKKRKEAGLTQAQLGEKVGKPQSYIARVERGGADVQVSVICEIVDGLEVTLTEFFGEVDGEFSGIIVSRSEHRGLGDVFETIQSLPETEQVWVQGVLEQLLLRFR